MHLILTLIINVAFGASAAATPSTKPAIPGSGSRVLFSEKSHQSSNRSYKADYEVKMDNQGRYRIDTLAGPFAGDFEIWDGKTLLQYSRVSNEVKRRVFPSNAGHPIPHPLFSPILLDRAKGAISRKKWTTAGENQRAGRTATIFRRQQGGVTIELEMDESMLLHASRRKGDQILHEISVKAIAPLNENEINFGLPPLLM